MSYRIGSRDYLSRAEQCLRKRDRRHLFYAAFELRCGIERRMQEYLQPHPHVSEKSKNEWKVARLGKGIEKAFASGEKVVEVAVAKKDKADDVSSYYYSPVSKSLQKKCQRLGGLLHGARELKQDDDAWWTETRQFLLETCDELREATRGTLLGPPLRNERTGEVFLVVEVEGGSRSQTTLELLGATGSKLHMTVRLHDKFPEEDHSQHAS